MAKKKVWISSPDISSPSFLQSLMDPLPCEIVKPITPASIVDEIGRLRDEILYLQQCEKELADQLRDSNRRVIEGKNFIAEIGGLRSNPYVDRKALEKEYGLKWLKRYLKHSAPYRPIRIIPKEE